MNYYLKCQNFIKHLETKYPTQIKISALRVALLSLKEFFAFSLPKLKQNKEPYIAFIFGGGIGDLAMALLYLQEIYKILPQKMKLDIYSWQNPKITQTLCPSNVKKANFYSYKTFDKNINKYDLAIRFDVQFPFIEKENIKKIKELSPLLKTHLDNVKNFYKTYPQMFENNMVHLHQNYAFALNKNRISCIDVDNSLNINEKTKLHIKPLPANAVNILKKYNLEKDKFITISRSVDIKNKIHNSIRFWTEEYYDILTEKIKKAFPNIKIVQLGSNTQRCSAIKNIDINLIGQTSLEECISIICSSALHIDTEGGLVHLRHLISQKPSLVLFGPTSVNFKGYPENLNLRSDICKTIACEGILGENWQQQCLKGYKEPPCMKELKPEDVFKKLKSFIKENKLF